MKKQAEISTEIPKGLDLYPFFGVNAKNLPWAEARKVNPNIDGFVGHNKEGYFFQERGNPVGVMVRK